MIRRGLPFYVTRIQIRGGLSPWMKLHILLHIILWDFCANLFFCSQITLKDYIEKFVNKSRNVISLYVHNIQKQQHVKGCSQCLSESTAIFYLSVLSYFIVQTGLERLAPGILTVLCTTSKVTFHYVHVHIPLERSGWYAHPLFLFFATGSNQDAHEMLFCQK